jgi:hypothetical protein
MAGILCWDSLFGTIIFKLVVWKQSIHELTFKIRYIHFHTFYCPSPEDYLREI